MHVPKAAMNKNHCAKFWKNNIWLAGQVLSMKAKPKATAMQDAADKHFRLRILPTNAGHHPASGGFVDDIRQADAISGVMPTARWKYFRATL